MNSNSRCKHTTCKYCILVFLPPCLAQTVGMTWTDIHPRDGRRGRVSEVGPRPEVLVLTVSTGLRCRLPVCPVVDQMSVAR